MQAGCRLGRAGAGGRALIASADFIATYIVDPRRLLTGRFRANCLPADARAFRALPDWHEKQVRSPASRRLYHRLSSVMDRKKVSADSTTITFFPATSSAAIRSLPGCQPVH